MAQKKRPSARSRTRTHSSAREHAGFEGAAERMTGESGESRPRAHRRGQEHVREVASDLAPQLGAAAAVAVATAIIEAEMLPAVLIGAGAALLPKLLPDAGYALRPMLKSALRAGYSALGTAQRWAAEASEQMQDIVAEVRTEQQSSSEGMPHASGRAGGESAQSGA